MRNGYYYIPMTDELLIINEPNCSWLWLKQVGKFACINPAGIKKLFGAKIKFQFIGGI